MGDFPSPVRHRCDVHGVLSSAMPLRYDRLYRITSREREYVCAGVRVTSEKQGELEGERRREREREGGTGYSSCTEIGAGVPFSG